MDVLIQESLILAKTLKISSRSGNKITKSLVIDSWIQLFWLNLDKYIYYLFDFMKWNEKKKLMFMSVYVNL